MDHFSYKNGVLCAEDVALDDLAKRFGTPLYVYSEATLTRHYQVMAEAFKAQNLEAQIFFAVKANGNLAVLKALGNLGAGADILSLGEFKKAQAAGIDGQRIVFSGVGKSLAEIDYALQNNIYQINVESWPELELINARAMALGVKAPIALRVNPDVEAKTHKHISTGKKDNKFGIDIDKAPEFYMKAQEMAGVNPVGVAVHIGSQLLELDPYRLAFEKLAKLAQELITMGIALKRLDIGGGLGIPYHDEKPASPSAYAAMIKSILGKLNLPIMLEPGRLIAGNAGVLMSSVLYEKITDHKRFIICDAAMNDLMRPALYSAYHKVQAVEEAKNNSEMTKADLVGPICESTDCFAFDRKLPSFDMGDLLVLKSTGAYCATMSSTYNMRPLVAEVMVNGDKASLIRPRQSYEDMIKQDRLATWQDIDV